LITTTEFAAKRPSNDMNAIALCNINSMTA